MNTPNEFFTKVEMPDGCWLWTGATSNGYGSVKWFTQVRKAYRVAYELMVGPVPEGLELDHLCRNPLCVRPDHLEAVTHRENILRGNAPPAWQARRTHCVHGHEFTEGNVVFTRKRRGRNCLICKRARGKREAQKLRDRRRAMGLNARGEPYKRASA